jgi:hypothetical protein
MPVLASRRVRERLVMIIAPQPQCKLGRGDSSLQPQQDCPVWTLDDFAQASRTDGISMLTKDEPLTAQCTGGGNKEIMQVDMDSFSSSLLEREKYKYPLPVPMMLISFLSTHHQHPKQTQLNQLQYSKPTNFFICHISQPHRDDNSQNARQAHHRSSVARRLPGHSGGLAQRRHGSKLLRSLCGVLRS